MAALGNPSLMLRLARDLDAKLLIFASRMTGVGEINPERMTAYGSPHLYPECPGVGERALSTASW